MHLLIDIGNTRIKAGLFSENSVQAIKIFDHAEALVAWAKAMPIKAFLLSSVGLPEEQLHVLQEQLPGKCFVLTPALPVPLTNAYASAETLGADRLAAAVAAYHLAKGKPALVFDAGTCLTAEFVDEAGRYCGGSISPGLQMRLKAMHQFTQKLPLLKAREIEVTDFIGNTTRSSMESGALYGMLAEIEGTIDRYQQIAPKLQVFLSGGDVKIFESKINRRIFAIPEIVLLGLNEILRYNASNK